MRLRALTMALAMTTALVATPALSPPAQAATPDHWGFAYVDNPTAAVWTTLDPTRQWGSWKTAFPASWAQGVRIAPGRFLVRFPHIGLGSRGNVHVTPVNRTGHYCEIVRWYQSGADEIVDVQCHKPGGDRDDTPFTVLWTVNSGVLPPGVGSYASLQYNHIGVAQWYNSTGGGVSATPIGIGQYHVVFNGVGTTAGLSGHLQATAVHPNAGPRRCKIAGWYQSGLDIGAYVFCFDQAGALVNSEFTISYHRERSVYAAFAPPKYFGYIWSAGGVLTNYNSVLGYGANLISAVTPPGHYLVKYPQLAQYETHAQVTAFGTTSHYCHLTQPWTLTGPDVVVDVMCFDNTGTPAPHHFFSTFSSRA